MITYAARTPGKTKHLFNEGYEPYEYVFISVDKEGRVILSPESIDKIVKRIAEVIKKDATV